MNPIRILLLGIILVFLPGLSAEAEEPKIREFDLKTIEALGRELYQRDHLARRGRI